MQMTLPLSQTLGISHVCPLEEEDDDDEVTQSRLHQGSDIKGFQTNCTTAIEIKTDLFVC